MSFEEDLKEEAYQTFLAKWSQSEARVVPDDTALPHTTNEGSLLDCVVLYTDLADSTEMVSIKTLAFSAEVYKAFLRCACKIIRSLEGVVTAFDGDRVMAVFIGESKNTNAVKSALKISYAVRNVINPSMKRVYKDIDFVIRHGTGVDNGKLLIARAGVRGANDLVWVGTAANVAAKLSALREDNYNTWISKNVFDMMSKEVKYATNGNLMWEARNWVAYNKTIYCSHYTWSL